MHPLDLSNLHPRTHSRRSASALFPYAPYWLEHCRPVSDRDDETEFTWYNDLIDMYWAGEWHEWKRKGKWEVTIMLPPTKGLVLLQYREDIRGLER